MKTLKLKKSVKLISVILAAALFTTGVCISAVNTKKQAAKQNTSLYEQVLADHGFVYGINYYTVPGGLGDTPATGAECAFDADALRVGLYNIRQTGMDAVQIWLFSRTCGLEYTENGEVTGVQEKFLKNLRTTCEIAKEIGIYVSFTIQPHFDYTLESGLYGGSKINYDKYTRFIKEPAVRSNYIEKAVKPVLNVLKDYPEVLFGITAYCEPEGDIYGEQNGYLPWGTTIETMTEFIGTIVDATRQILPKVPVSLACGWNYKDSVRYFNKLGLDYIGMDIYDDYSKVQDLSQLMLTSPVMMSEFGPGESAGSTNSYFHIKNYQDFISNAIQGGYVGAFYWCYDSKGTMRSFLGSTDSDYLPIMAAAHYTIIDNKNFSAGIEDAVDTPVMLYPDTDGTIRFFASRTAVTYEIERSTDGKNFSVVGSIDADEADANSTLICSYTDRTTAESTRYYYRVASLDENGKRYLSDVSCPVKTMKTVCSDEENLVRDHSFENYTVAKDAFDIYFDQTGDHFSFVKGEAGDTVHSGNQAFRIEGNGDWSWVARKVTGLKPNTKYVYTFHVWADGEGSIQAKVLDESRKNLGLYNISSAYQNQWVKYTYIFDSGDNDTVLLVFADVGGTFNIDDLYLFPYTE